MSSDSYSTVECRLSTDAETAFRDCLTAACSALARIGPGLLVLYGLTTLDLDTDAGDDFRTPGVSTEHRFEPQITVGLFSDASGFPVAVGDDECNMAGTCAMQPMLGRFSGTYNVDDITVVADTGMF